MFSSRAFSWATRIRCARMSDSLIWGALAMASASSGPTLSARAGQQRQGKRKMLVGGEPEAKPELGVVLKQRIRPCRARDLPRSLPTA